MILDFKVKNYRSFRDEAIFSMIPVNAYKEHFENMHTVKLASSSNFDVLKAAVIYGSNASGKTNLFRAIDYARALILGTAKPFQRAPFVGCEQQETHFSFSLLIGDIRYYYEFSLNSKNVTQETLRAQPKQERLIFKRTFQKNGVYKVEQGSNYRGISIKLRDYSDNGLVLGLLSKYGIKDCETVFRWFLESLTIVNNADNIINDADLVQKLNNLDEENFSKVINAVKQADLGITGAQLVIDDLSEEEKVIDRVMTEKLNEIHKILTGENVNSPQLPSKKISFQFQHNISNNNVGFGFDNESFGTVSMLNLAILLFDAIEKGKTIIIDEIDRSIHPVLFRSLISIFFDKDFSSHVAQLIFTTHDLTLMNDDLLRRDQFWFVEKNHSQGSSELFALSEYSPRKDDNLLNRYLYGAYGAIPYIEKVN